MSCPHQKTSWCMEAVGAKGFIWDPQATGAGTGSLGEQGQGTLVTPAMTLGGCPPQLEGCWCPLRAPCRGS